LFLGRAALGRGEPEAAIAHLERSLECKPDAIEPASALVQAHIAAGKPRAAIALAEQLEARSPELGRKLGAQAWVAQARRHRQRGDEVAPLAIDDFREALEKQPGDLDIVRQLADTLIDLSYVDQALALVKEHFDAQSHPVDWHYFAGRCHAARLELPVAETELRAVLVLEPRHASALIELARLALDDGRPEEARDWLQTATQTEPRLSRAWMMLGEAHEALRDDRLAESDYRQACDLQPGNSKAQYRLGRLLLRTGRDAEGESLLHLAVADDDEKVGR
jgi:tetratricopeptide (TPR) repeat protein